MFPIDSSGVGLAVSVKHAVFSQLLSYCTVALQVIMEEQTAGHRKMLNKLLLLEQLNRTEQ